jgi:formate dehydrogenase iron-sulfur subunit
MSTWAILTDVTKCIGCEQCVAGCREANDLPESAPRPWDPDIDELSANRWTTIDRLGPDRYVRRQCRHCLEPACASACPVGALRRSPEGAVVYDASKCMGCRYCMMACPFRIPRYSWESAAPAVRKCVLCHDRIRSGEAEEPGCTAACPTGATIFGKRDELLAEARRRIAAAPDRYLPRVFGEHEVGGTAILNVSDVEIHLPGVVPDDPLPGRTWPALRAVPFAFFGMGAAMVGLRWLIGRRNELRARRATESLTPEDPIHTKEDEE